MRRCDTCGRTGNATIGMGGATICNQCEPDVREEMDRLRQAGQPVNVMHIARRIFRATNRGSDFLLKDWPADLRALAEDRASRDGTSIRELILSAVEAYVSGGST
ncbi:MAG: hypothetical protein PHY29_02770 [Syntrophales bacterium]|nr:hypothetical protein [Syntrophales bacterium]